MNDWNSLTYACLTIKSDVYEAFVNPEESFQEGPFYVQITRNLLIYLQIFHEYGPLYNMKQTVSPGTKEEKINCNLKINTMQALRLPSLQRSVLTFAPE